MPPCGVENSKEADAGEYNNKPTRMPEKESVLCMEEERVKIGMRERRGKARPRKGNQRSSLSEWMMKAI